LSFSKLFYSFAQKLNIIIMNTATKNLEEDHVHILRLLDVMGRIVGSENPDIRQIETIVDIIKNFADGSHHAKEENQFFPFLEKRGFSLSQGPVAVMLNEHMRGRDFVRGIVDNIAFYKSGDISARDKIYSNMAGYTELLKNHISKENNILFRMADNALSAEDHQELLKQFEQAENKHASGTSSSEYVRIIEQLASAYGV
jgi:hemerythrin-like domain-containing protein